MLRTFLKPDCFRKSTAFALRMPLLQCATISSSGSSSPTRFGKFAERNQSRAGNAADLEFVRLAHVDQREIVAAIELRLDFRRLDIAGRRYRFRRPLP